MTHDPIVEEVRMIREQLAAKFDFDIGRIIADARIRQALSGKHVIAQTGRPSAERAVELQRDQSPEACVN